MDKKIVQRRSLSKLIGKELRYHATFEKHGTGGNTMFVNVMYKNKIVADHLWVSNKDEFHCLEHGDEISFLATAKSYKNKKGVRKYGLTRCYRVHSSNIMDKVRSDNREKRKRLLSKK